MRAADNPFASHRLERLGYRFADGSWSELIARLASLGWRGAIVGPDGSGKTTLLEQLARRLRAAGREVRRVDAEPRHGPSREALAAALAEPRPGAILLVDAADALRPREWSALSRGASVFGGLVVTAHREGLLPTLHRASTEVELLRELVVELAGAEVAAAADLAELHERHHGDARAALRELYDRFAGR